MRYNCFFNKIEENRKYIVSFMSLWSILSHKAPFYEKPLTWLNDLLPADGVKAQQQNDGSVVQAEFEAEEPFSGSQLAADPVGGVYRQQEVQKKIGLQFRAHFVSSIFLLFKPFTSSMVNSPLSCSCMTAMCKAPLTYTIWLKKQLSPICNDFFVISLPKNNFLVKTAFITQSL